MYREIKQEELRIDKALGYIYFLDKNHPLATGNASRVYYHRHIASIKEGRWLTSDENVHHIDNNKLNNNTCNLQVLSSVEHGKIHQSRNTKEVDCKTCSKIFLQKHVYQIFCCPKCRDIGIIILKTLSKEELEYLIWTKPFIKLAKEFNCSDNGIRKWAIRLRCLMPPSRFHTKFIDLEDKLKEYNKRGDLTPL